MFRIFLRFTFIPFAFITFFAGILDAQQKSGENEETISASIQIYRWAFSNTISIPNLKTGVVSRVASDNEGELTLWFQSDGTWRSVDIPTGSQSAKINYTGPAVMRFYTKSGESDYKEAGKLEIPAAAKDIAALMFKKGDNIRFYAMNISPDKLPKGKIAVMNMTAHNVAISISGDAKLLRMGSYLVFSPKKNDNKSIQLGIARFFEKKWNQVYDNNIYIQNDKRNVVLIYDPYNKKTPKFSVQILAF